MIAKAWRIHAVVAVGALLAGLLATAAPAQEPSDQPPAACPDPHPLAEVDAGDTGTGYVTVDGTEPAPFDAEVVRVVDDRARPGRDVIVAELSGEAIEQAGVSAPWSGMSGAPVYADDGRLLGAVALRLGDGIAGLTPASQILDLAQGEAGASAAAAGSASAGEVELDAADRQAIAEVTGAGAQQLDAQRLPLPLQVAGLGQQGRDALRAGADEHGLPLAVQPAQAGDTGGDISQDAVDRLGPGTPIAQRLAGGDVQAYHAGTTTVVCDGQAVALGHPVSLGGDVDTGANVAEVATISDSPIGTPVVTPLIGEAIGRIGQDRLAGLRAQLGEPPEAAGITTDITDTASGRSRTGTTSVAQPDFLALAISSHVGRNIETVQNRSGQGTAVGSLTISGTTADGDQWQLTRSNRYASQSLIGAAPGNELSALLAQLQGNEFAEVTVDDVDMDLEVDRDYRDLRVEQVTAAIGERTVQLDPAEPQPVQVEPGQQIELTVQLRPWQQPGQRHQAQLSLQAPADFAGPAMLRVGSPTSPSLGVAQQVQVALDGLQPTPVAPPAVGPAAPASVDTFSGLVDHLSQRPRNDEIVAELVPESSAGPVPQPPEASAQQAPGAVSPDALAADRQQVDEVVRGAYQGPLLVGEPAPEPTAPEPGEPEPGEQPGEPGPVQRLAGPDRVGTAVAISQAEHPDGADTVVIARAGEFADALAGGPLAAHHGAPMLLVRQSGLPEATASEIARLQPQRAVVLGGAGAVPPAVVDQLGQAVDQVERVAGDDRYATAAAIAERLPESATAYVAAGASNGSGSAWADALSAGAAASTTGGKVLLTGPDQLPAATAEAVSSGQPAVIVGGEAAVSPQVQAALAQQAGEVARVAGETRYATSVQLAQRLLGDGATPPAVWLATGQAAPDALAAAPAAADSGPLLLVAGQSLEGSPASARALTELAPAVDRLVLVGGDAAISSSVAEQVRSLAQQGGGS